MMVDTIAVIVSSVEAGANITEHTSKAAGWNNLMEQWCTATAVADLFEKVNWSV